MSWRASYLYTLRLGREERVLLKEKLAKYKKIPNKLVGIVLDVSNKEAIIETIIVLLTLLILSLSAVDMFLVDNIAFTKFVEVFDLLVCAIFAVDLYYHYRKAEVKKTFLRKHVLELFAIIPLDVAFRVLRLARLFRLAKLSRLSKLGRFGNVLNKFVLKFLNPSYFRLKRFKNFLVSLSINKVNDED